MSGSDQKFTLSKEIIVQVLSNSEFIQLNPGLSCIGDQDEEKETDYKRIVQISEGLHFKKMFLLSFLHSVDTPQHPNCFIFSPGV